MIEIGGLRALALAAAWATRGGAITVLADAMSFAFAV